MTESTIELLVKLAFRLLQEKQLRKSFEKSLANLAALCEKTAP